MEIENVNPEPPPSLLSRLRPTPLFVVSAICLMASASISISLQTWLRPSVIGSYSYVGLIGVSFLCLFFWFLLTTTEEKVRGMKLKISLYVLTFTTFYTFGLDSLPTGSLFPIIFSYIAIKVMITAVHLQGKKMSLPKYATALNTFLIGVGFTILQKVIPHDSHPLPKYGVVILGLGCASFAVYYLDIIDDIIHPGAIQPVGREQRRGAYFPIRSNLSRM